MRRPHRGNRPRRWTTSRTASTAASSPPRPGPRGRRGRRRGDRRGWRGTRRPNSSRRARAAGRRPTTSSTSARRCSGAGADPASTSRTVVRWPARQAVANRSTPEEALPSAQGAGQVISVVGRSNGPPSTGFCPVARGTGRVSSGPGWGPGRRPKEKSRGAPTRLPSGRLADGNLLKGERLTTAPHGPGSRCDHQPHIGQALAGAATARLASTVAAATANLAANGRRAGRVDRLEQGASSKESPPPRPQGPERGRRSSRCQKPIPTNRKKARLRNPPSEWARYHANWGPALHQVLAADTRPWAQRTDRGPSSEGTNPDNGGGARA